MKYAKEIIKEIENRGIIDTDDYLIDDGWEDYIRGKRSMTKAELMNLVGKKVAVTLKDGDKICGILGYVDEFSAKHDYRKPNYFYIGNTSFKVSHVRKLAESEE